MDTLKRDLYFLSGWFLLLISILGGITLMCLVSPKIIGFLATIVGLTIGGKLIYKSR